MRDFFFHYNFMENTYSILIVVGLLILLFFGIRFYKKHKCTKIGAMALFTGGVKCGKTTVAVATALSEYRSRCRKIRIKNFFIKFFHKGNLIEMPLLYSNIPLNVPYVPLTDDLLLRKHRFVYGSVIYVCEASLVADSMLIKDMTLNERLLMFNKLIGHETKGGCIIYDTQCISDCHFSIKRCLSEYVYIHHLVKWVPFFLIAYVREDRYSDDGSIIVTSNRDVELDLRKIIIPKSTWKKFDCYCYSSFTDDLPVSCDVVDGKSLRDLKARDILSFKNKK